jgi:hypothetical protein
MASPLVVRSPGPGRRAMKTLPDNDQGNTLGLVLLGNN